MAHREPPGPVFSGLPRHIRVNTSVSVACSVFSHQAGPIPTKSEEPQSSAIFPRWCLLVVPGVSSRVVSSFRKTRGVGPLTYKENSSLELSEVAMASGTLLHPISAHCTIPFRFRSVGSTNMAPPFLREARALENTTFLLSISEAAPVREERCFYQPSSMVRLLSR